MSNAARGRRRRALEAVGEAGTGDEPRPTDPGTPHPDTKTLRRRWAELIKRVYEVDPLVCPSCGGEMRIIAFIVDPKVVDHILRHLARAEGQQPPRGPPERSDLAAAS